MSVQLPANKTFLMSQQLSFLQTNRSRAFGFQIVGGAGGARPVLKLKDGSRVAGNVFIHFVLLPSGTVQEYDSEHYNSRMRGVNVDLGNNPLVSGISMSGAQLCSIEDVVVTGTAFYAGLNGLPGSGGFSANVAVHNGDYGVVETTFRPNPSINGLVLVGQRKAGVLIDVARGPVVLSGFSIESPPTPSSEYRAVLLANRTASKDNAFNGEDGTIVLHGGGASVAIESEGSDVVLKNVFFLGAATLVSCPAQNVSLLPVGPLSAWVRADIFVFSGSSGQIWDHGHSGGGGMTYLTQPIESASAPQTDLITQHSWAFGEIPTWQSPRVLNVCEDYGATPQWVNATDDDGAKIQEAIVAACTPSSPAYGSVVFIPHGQFGLFRPLDLLGCAQLIGSGTHSTVLTPVRGDEGGCWSASPSTMRCSPAPQYMDLTGNDLVGSNGHPLPQPCTTPALCCDMCTNHNPAAEPLGQCRAWSWSNASKTCWMKSGMSKNPYRASTDVSGVVNPGALLVSTDSVITAAHGAAPSMLVADISLYTSPECPFVDVGAGRDTLWRDVGISLSGANTPPPLNVLSGLGHGSAPPSAVPRAPYVSLRGTVSGKFFGLPLDGIFGGSNAGDGGPLHVLILVSGTGLGGPIHFYQASTEHLAHDPQVLVTNSQDVHFHAWKYESSLNEKSSVPPNGSGSLVRVAYSHNVTSFGASGNYRLYSAAVPMIAIHSSANITVLGMVRKAAWNEVPNGTVWLRDDAGGVALPGDKALLLYRS
jgi:hypothetical protein